MTFIKIFDACDESLYGSNEITKVEPIEQLEAVQEGIDNADVLYVEENYSTHYPEYPGKVEVNELPLTPKLNGLIHDLAMLLITAYEIPSKEKEVWHIVENAVHRATDDVRKIAGY